MHVWSGYAQYFPIPSGLINISFSNRPQESLPSSPRRVLEFALSLLDTTSGK